jgi:hypothetical protein
MISFAEWLVFAATGRILIYLWMTFPEPPFMKLPYWLEKLHRCDLCSGVWVYAILAVALKLDLFGFGNLITEAATGAVTSYLVHLFWIGVKEKFSPPIIV